MKFVPYIGFVLAALAAASFVVFPLWRASARRAGEADETGDGEAISRKARALLAGAVALFVLGIGIGVYWAVGQPQLALRDAAGLESNELGSLTPLLIQRVRENPDDEQAWLYLARIYITAGDARPAGGALGKAIAIGKKRGTENANLYTAHGEVLAQADGGRIGDAAQASFAAALKLDPKNAPARYYLGLAAQQKGDVAGAQGYWQALMDELPANSPLRAELIDRMASLGTPTQRVMGEGGAPDIHAMVSGLEARLQKEPNDPAGWQRLIRAWSVLGDTQKAQAALASARKAAGGDAMAQAALDRQARELKLE